MNVWHGTDRRRRMYVAHFGRFWRSKVHGWITAALSRGMTGLDGHALLPVHALHTPGGALKLTGFGSNCNADSVGR